MNEGAAVALAADLALGASVLLGLGTLVVLLSRAPVHRQRIAELAIVATLTWLVLALAPLPRRSRPLASAPAADAPTLDISATASTADRATAPVATSSAPIAAEAAEELPLIRERAAVEGARRDPERATIPSSTPASTTDGVPRWLRIALVVYIVGAVTVLANVLLGAILVRRLVARASPPPAWLGHLFDARRRALGVRRCRLRVTSAARRPLSAGIAHPAVLLPAALVDRARESELRCVIDHELVHVARADTASRSLMAWAAAVLWPHPLFWFLRSRALLSAELIADDAASALPGRSAYAHMLMSLAEELHALKPAPGLVPGSYRHATEFTRRIEMLISKHDRLATRWSPARRVVHATAALAAVAFCSLAFGVRPGVAATSGAPVVGVSERDATRTIAAAQQAQPPQQTRGRQSQDEQTAQPQQQPRGQQRPQALQQPQGQQSPQPEQQARGQQRPRAEQAPEQAGQSMPQVEQRATQGQEVRQQDVDAFYAQTLALVERAIKLKSDLLFVTESFESVRKRGEAGVVDETEVAIARSALETTQRTLQAVLILVQSEIDATQLEIAAIEKQIQLGQLDDSARVQQVRLQGRLKALQSVL